MDSYENLSKTQPASKWVYFFAILAEIFGLTCIILLLSWRLIYHGGFDPTVSRLTALNLHTLLMFISMIFLYANTIMLFRMNCGVKRGLVKLAHGAFNLVIIIIASVGMHYAFTFHGAYDDYGNQGNQGDPAQPRENVLAAEQSVQERHLQIGKGKYYHSQMFSLHSWIGITTIILFVIQWFFGFGSFFVQLCSARVRDAIKPLHAFLGCFIFVMSVATTITGITQLAYYDLGVKYEYMVPEGVLANCFGLILMFFAGLVLFIMLNECFRKVETYELADVKYSETAKLTDR